MLIPTIKICFPVQRISKCVNSPKSSFLKFDRKTIFSLPYMGENYKKKVEVMNLGRGEHERGILMLEIPT